MNLAQPLTVQQENSLAEVFSEMAGIRQFEVRDSSNLRITYDLMTVNLQSIEEMLNELNCRLSNKILQRFKKGWIHYLEENECENMKFTPHSCCKDPTIK